MDKAEFFVGSKAHDKSDRIIYNANNGKLFFDHDGKAAIPRCSSPYSTIICTSRCTTFSWSPDGGPARPALLSGAPTTRSIQVRSASSPRRSPTSSPTRRMAR